MALAIQAAQANRGQAVSFIILIQRKHATPMPTIHRLYLYTLALLGLVAGLWAANRLIHSLSSGDVARPAGWLAADLPLLLIGLLAFGFQWRLAQRQASRYPFERSAPERAVFLYAALLVTLLPALLELLALAIGLSGNGDTSNRALAFLEHGGSPAAHLAALLLNLLAAGYFFTILREDWQAPRLGEALERARFFFYHLWLVLGLGMAVFGLQQLLEFALARLGAAAVGSDLRPAAGLASLLAGAPVWFYTERRAQDLLARALSSARETGQSAMAGRLRLAVLQAVLLLALAGLLVPAGLILTALLRALFELALAGLLGRVARPLSIALAWLPAWLVARAALQDESGLRDYARSRRLYEYTLALAGLLAAFLGLQRLLLVVIEALIGGSAGWQGDAAIALSALLIGLPLWLLTWLRLTREANQPGEAGELARRAPARRVYLYGALSLGALGLISRLGGLLGAGLSGQAGWLVIALQALVTLLFYGLALGYHARLLQADLRAERRAAGRRYSLFPVLLVDPENEDGFAESMLAALESHVPGLPVAVHPASQGAPDESLSAARAVILPAELAARPPESLRLWLQSYPGARLVVPAPAKDWLWISSSGDSLLALAERTARLIKRLAEGGEE